MLAGLLLAAWVIAGFLVFKICFDGIRPLEITITRRPRPWTYLYGLPFLKLKGVNVGE
ncbi:MAG: hypothetical protein IPO75_13815 [Betaproteobacteria bacterium]|nr:hypothetical protein [Betaproteobacteria bacterium]